ncbi:MAG: prepilin-type N-terminal cleavage/methylation domain-containing protein [bacterium]|nr:prepilin-type N-terminal cleavage/methylation domain-containing protein [bacterium]
MSSKRRFFSSGFTLLELLVVIAILGILATIGLGSFASSQAKSRDSKRKSDLKNIAIVLETFYNDNIGYPVGAAGKIQGCGTDANATCGWGEAWTNNGVVYMSALPKDNSAFDYYYESDGVSYELYARLENTNDKQAAKLSGADAGYTGTTCLAGTPPVLCNFVSASTNASINAVEAE